jgi:flagellar FliL protein
MADDDGLDLGGEDAAGADAGKKKGGGGGLGALLPNLLKFAAIGLGALIFIVTVSVITYNILNSRGESQTPLDPTSEYMGSRPQYSTYRLIGRVTTRTRDQTHIATVDMGLGYDLNNNAASTELTARVDQLKDFTREYFSKKRADELEPENVENLKIEIRELLNTRYLDTAKVREIYFYQLDVMEM